MGFYDDIANTAEAEIADKGRNVTLRHTAAGSYNPATDVFTDSNTDETVKAVITDYNQYQINGIVQVGDKRVMIAANAVASAPVENDIIIDGSDQYRVLNVTTVKPGATAVLYKLQVRK